MRSMNVILTGDYHSGNPLTYQRVYTNLSNRILMYNSYLTQEAIHKFANKLGSYVLCAGDMQTDVLSAAQQAPYEKVFTALIQPETRFINSLGNHDFIATGVTLGYSATLRNIFTTQDQGYKLSGTQWANIIINNKVSVIVIHNIQDKFVSGSWQYPYVNPNNGLGDSLRDWAGISNENSVQRIWIRDRLQEAIDNNYHVIVVGHRTTYCLGGTGIRPPLTEALAATGYITELEDWCSTNNRNVLLLTGDVHSYSLTDATYRNQATITGGVIHYNTITGPTIRPLIPQYYNDLYLSWIASVTADSNKPIYTSNLQRSIDGYASHPVLFTCMNITDTSVRLNLYTMASIADNDIINRRPAGLHKPTLLDSHEMAIESGRMIGGLHRRPIRYVDSVNNRNFLIPV